MTKPRVRSKDEGKEVILKTYEEFQNPKHFDEQVFTDGLRKVAQRDYQKGVQKIGASFGFTKSSVSRRWIKESEKALEELNERDLNSFNLVALFLDGKRFHDRGVLVAVGVKGNGQKKVVGIYECNSENSAACNEMLQNLEKRGLSERELLFIVDGGSGLNKALEQRYDVHLPEKRRAVRVRCFVHKWRNIADLLDDEAKPRAAALFWGIRGAAKLDIALECSDRLEALLKESNESALRIYLEAKDDLLIIQRLGLTPSLKKTFSTTNPVESVNSLTQEDLRRVKNWENSNQFQRWIAAASLAAEKRMRRVRGFQEIPALKSALSRLCIQEKSIELDEVLMTGT